MVSIELKWKGRSTLRPKSVVENKSHCVNEWHKILAHRNLSDILEMGRQGLGIRKCSCEFICEPCIKGKLSRNSFKLSKRPTKCVLDCIASELGGPLQVESIILLSQTFTVDTVKFIPCEQKLKHPSLCDVLLRR